MSDGYSYTVKVSDPECKGGFSLEQLHTHTKFESMDQLHAELSTLKGFASTNYQCGYIVPGHGLKGKQKLLTTTEDLVAMYCDYKGKQIKLWVKRLQARKRSNSPKPGASSAKVRRTNYDSHLDKMSEVELILEDLKEKQGTKYSPEQLHAWAHMIHMKKHDSYECPPDKPFFGKLRKHAAETSLSPGKRINMRSECIDQLEKWHKLMECGAISNDQYKELKDTILKDINNF